MLKPIHNALASRLPWRIAPRAPRSGREHALSNRVITPNPFLQFLSPSRRARSDAPYQLPFALLCLAVLLAGCQTKPTQSKFVFPVSGAPMTAPATNVAVTVGRPLNLGWLQPDTNAFLLGPGDRLEVEIIGDNTSRTTTVVGPDGKIYFNLLPGIEVWGLSLGQTKARLEQGLTNLVKTESKVAVTLREVGSKRVWLLGRLNKPAMYTMAGPMTLLEAIALAGGPTTPTTVASVGGGFSVSVSSGTDEVADLSRSFVIRQGQVLPVDFWKLLREGDMSQNIFLQPDDFVYLASAVAPEVFVLGAVAQPHAVAYSERMTLVAAVAGAGGTIKDAYLSHVAIVRGSMAQPTITVVDYKDIIRGRAQDVLLEPRDIVYVPFSPYRILSRYADLILNTFARTVGANEGARAVDSGARPVSPNVSVGGGVSIPVGR